MDIAELLAFSVKNKASDLHLKVPSPPMVRVDGQLRPLDGFPVVEPPDAEAALRTILIDPEKLAGFESEGEADFAYAIPGAVPTVAPK